MIGPIVTVEGLRDGLISVAPLAIVWLVALSPGLIARRGRTRVRWAALRRRRAGQSSAALGGGAIDVSTDAAAAILSGRLYFVTQVACGFVIIWLVTSGASWLVGLVACVVLVWLATRAGTFAAVVHALLSGHINPATTKRALRYYYLRSDAQGWRRWFSRSLSGGVIVLVGVIMLVAAGLSWAYDSNVITTGVPFGSVQVHSLSPFWVAWIMVAMGGVLVLSGERLDRRARRRDMTDLTTIDPAGTASVPTVVFLRQFEKEEIRVPRHVTGRDEPVWWALIPRRHVFLEDALTWVCWSFGQVVAIADPRRRPSNTVGAGKHLVPFEQSWQDAVLELVESAQLIIVIAGDTEGIRWEIQTILGSPAWAAKALFVNPDPRNPDAFRTAIGVSESWAAGEHRALIGAVWVHDSLRPVCSDLAEDVDYSAAVLVLARRRGLVPEVTPRPSR